MREWESFLTFTTKTVRPRFKQLTKFLKARVSSKKFAGLYLTLCLLGLIAAITLWLAARKRARQTEQRNLDALVVGKAIELEHRMGTIRKCFYGLLIVAGSTLLSAGTFLCWCFTANALFDRSPITTKNVRITDMIETSHDFIIRDYRLKYRFPEKAKDDELLTTLDHLMEFDAPIGVAEIQSGWLGWPWVKTVRPMKIADVLPNNG